MSRLQSAFPLGRACFVTLLALALFALALLFSLPSSPVTPVMMSSIENGLVGMGWCFFRPLLHFLAVCMCKIDCLQLYRQTEWLRRIVNL